MRQTLRWLLLIPFALLTAMGVGWVFLFFATFTSPELATLVFRGMERLGDSVMNQALSGFDPGPLIRAAGAGGLRLMVAVLVAPVVIMALASELFRWPGALMQMTLTGLLATVLPAGLLGLSRVPTGPELRILAALFLTGAVCGAVYWMIAGRGARPRSAISAPPA